MPNVISRQIIHDGLRNAIVKCHIDGDASGDETAALLLDISAHLTMGLRTEVKLTRVSADLAGWTAVLWWDATTNVPIVTLPDGDSDNDYTDVGGIRNNAGVGVTGDIDISTTGLGDEHGTITLYLDKVEGERAFR